MKKVGILTYHFALNYGAALQCYALKKALMNMGCDASILDYQTEQQIANNSIWHKRKGIKNVILQTALFPFLHRRMQKKRNFEQFQKENFNCTVPCRTPDELKKIIEEQKYDVIVAGSDQVWCPSIPDFTDMFFFPFQTKAKKIGYAVSIGNSTEKELSGFSEAIRDFSAIAVREQSAIQVVKKFAVLEPVEVVDPTLLLQKDDWDNIASQSKVKIPDKKYMICYFLKKEAFHISYELAKKIAQEKNLTPIFINQRFSKFSLQPNTVFNAGPSDFVKLFSCADYVCTDSFHGTIFSIIFKKQFYSFVEKENTKDQRRQNILKNLDLLSRCVYLDNVSLDRTPVDYHKMDERLSELREESLNFLRSNIEVDS